MEEEEEEPRGPLGFVHVVRMFGSVVVLCPSHDGARVRACKKGTAIILVVLPRGRLSWATPPYIRTAVGCWHVGRTFTCSFSCIELLAVHDAWIPKGKIVGKNCTTLGGYARIVGV